MDILGLSTSPSSGGAYALILNEIDGSRRLPIIIGSYEAQAIALELEHIKPPRPMTHDLTKLIVESFEYTLRHITINDLTEGTFFSKLVFDGPSGEVVVDSRPSDAIALAIRFDAPIYVATKVLHEAGIVSEESDGSTGKESVSKSEPGPKDTAVTRESGAENIETRIELLHSNMEAAIQAEDYELAARLRDEIQKLKGLL